MRSAAMYPLTKIYPLIIGALLTLSTELASSLSLSPTRSAKSATTTTPSSSSSRPAPNLNEKSTALDVLRELNNGSRLAPHVGSGGTAVVTGGNSGIGAESVRTLAAAGMRVILCSRSIESGEIVRSSLPGWCRTNVRVQRLDLADLYSVEEGADEILSTEGEIDVLLNNAGVMALPKREETAQGFELQFGTNHVGHHMLTRLLLPSVRRGGRVVTAASEAHRMGQLDMNDLNYDGGRAYSPWGAYGQSKLANVLFAKALDDRLKGEGEGRTGDARSVSVHPGVIGTNLWKYSTPSVVRGLITRLVSNKSTEQGAATNVYACLVEPSALRGGEYLSDCREAEPNENGRDVGGTMRRRLWERTEGMIRDAGFELPSELV